MDNNSEILAQKRAWRTSERIKDRRVKDGSFEDRKDLAEVLKAGKPGQMIPIRNQESKMVYSAFIMGICLVLALLMLIFWSRPAHAQEIPSNQAIATAIWHAEGGNRTSWPYGIKHHYKHTTPRQACLNTIRHVKQRWDGQGDFIVFLGRTYSPPAINPNWVRLVKWSLKHNGKEI